MADMTEKAEVISEEVISVEEVPSADTSSPNVRVVKKVIKKKIKKEKPAEVIYERSKTFPVIVVLMMWVGVVIGIISWLPEFKWFRNLGVSFNRYFVGALGLIGGLMCIAGIVLMIFSIKCPACGDKKLGRAMGAKIPKMLECPSCHKKVRFK